MQEQDIFIAASECGSPVERLGYFEQVCAGDAALRQRVEVLLGRSEQLGTFLDTPARGPATIDEVSPAAEGVGTRLGPYRLVEPLGEGGFGIVFRAEQTQP